MRTLRLWLCETRKRYENVTNSSAKHRQTSHRNSGRNWPKIGLWTPKLRWEVENLETVKMKGGESTTNRPAILRWPENYPRLLNLSILIEINCNSGLSISLGRLMEEGMTAVKAMPICWSIRNALIPLWAAFYLFEVRCECLQVKSPIFCYPCFN